MIEVIIPEPIPSMNKGEAAILEGLYEALNRFGEYNITVYSPPEWFDDDKRNYGHKYKIVDGVDLFDMANHFLDKKKPRKRSHFFKTWGKLLFFSIMHRISKRLTAKIFNDALLKRLSESDVILAGHDGMLDYYHFYLVLAANILGKPIALFGGGNDLKNREKYRTRKYLQYMVNKSIVFTVRDRGSLNYFLSNEVPEWKIKMYPDPAVMLKATELQRINEIIKIEKIPNLPETKFIGLIPVIGGIVFHKSFEHEKDLDRKHEMRVSLWVSLLTYLLENIEAHFIFLPHCIGPSYNNDDRRMNRYIYNALSAYKSRITLIENEYSANELKGLMRECDLVVGERAHGLIGSSSVGTPCVALTVKEDIINGMFGQKTFNLNKPDIEELKDILINAWDNRRFNRNILSKNKDIILKKAEEASMLLNQKIRRIFHTI